MAVWEAMALQPADPLPAGLEVMDADGRMVALPVRPGEATLLIFLRHLA
jgi:hypothetical protein